MDKIDTVRRVAELGIWKSEVEPVVVSGGITNANFLVRDAGSDYFVRIGDDIPVHGVMRFNELAASRAAHAAGISPEVMYHEPGVLVLAFIEGKTFEAVDVRAEQNLGRIVDLIMRCHRDIPRYLRGASMMFWVFHVLRDYAGTLREQGSRVVGDLPGLLAVADKLEQVIGPIDLVFGHNDLLPANFIDDGKRLWLIDWDYAGFNSPLFDLGGLASNNELSESQERWVLETYFDRVVGDDLLRRYDAMKCASLLRESMWSMVSEIYSTLDFDYVAYTTENLGRFHAAWSSFQERW